MLTVLFIEDTSLPGEVMAGLQEGGEKDGIVLDHVSSLEQARILTKGRAKSHDVIVFDLELVGEPGRDPLESVLTIAEGAAVVAITGMDDGEVAEAAVRRGAHDVLFKDHVTVDALRRSIRYAAQRAGFLSDSSAIGDLPLKTLFDGLEDGILVLDPRGAEGGEVLDFSFRFVNPAGARLLGLPGRDLIVSGFRYQADRVGLSGHFDWLIRVLEERRPTSVQAMVGGPNGRTWVRLSATPLDRGVVLTLVDLTPRIGHETQMRAALDEAHEAHETDISDLERAHRVAREREAWLSAITETMVDALVVIDGRGLVESFNPAAERMFGYKADQLLGQSINMLMGPEDAADHDGHLTRFLKTRTSKVIGIGRELWARRADGSDFPIELALSVMEPDGLPRFVGVIRDITDRKEYERRLMDVATREPLTGLPNRVLLREKLAAAARRARLSKHSFAVLFVDLDHFKKVNDSLGHVAGDLVIREIGRRVQDHLRPENGDLVAHLGGDEFTMILGAMPDREEVRRRADDLLADLARPYELDGREVYTTATLGAALFPEDGADIPTLLQNLDTAVHHAKREGRGGLTFYEEDQSESAARRLRVETGLRRALERGEFDLHYQAKVDLVTGGVVGAEALLRWDGLDVGQVSPVEFVPVAEETGLILPIGEWVLRRACEQTQAWARKGLPPIRMGVNLSARQFSDSELADKVGAILAETGLEPGMLDLELTESMLVEQGDQAVSALNRLKSLGITLSIDDFGTGYSSLSYLKRFPIDYLKIDRSFVMDLPDNNDDMAITRAIVSMASALRLRLVAEGIETPEQAEFLKGLGCELGQGYYYSKPVTAEAFEALIRGLDSGHRGRPTFRPRVVLGGQD